MKISLTLPSIYPAALQRALKNIRDATRNDYEVIVVGPKPPPGDWENVIWVREDPENAHGCNAGHAKSLRYATGDFIQAWVDDHLLVDGWDVMALRAYEEREAWFHEQVGVGKEAPFVLGLRHVWPTHVGTLFGVYYPYFPFVRRRYIGQVGWFDPAYTKGFADSDFALRVWAAGGRCEWSPNRLITVHPDDGRKDGTIMTDADMALAIARWAPQFPGWDTSHLRGFNNDITPERFPEFVGDRTVYHPDPGFKAVVGDGG